MHTAVILRALRPKGPMQSNATLRLLVIPNAISSLSFRAGSSREESALALAYRCHPRAFRPEGPLQSKAPLRLLVIPIRFHLLSFRAAFSPEESALALAYRCHPEGPQARRTPPSKATLRLLVIPNVLSSFVTPSGLQPRGICSRPCIPLSS
jgi:hypothetical protein